MARLVLETGKAAIVPHSISKFHDPHSPIAIQAIRVRVAVDAPSRQRASADVTAAASRWRFANAGSMAPAAAAAAAAAAVAIAVFYEAVVSGTAAVSQTTFRALARGVLRTSERRLVSGGPSFGRLLPCAPKRGSVGRLSW
jgi:anti-sigma-K factor RskA